jgi:hypothetical protein
MLVTHSKRTTKFLIDQVRVLAGASCDAGLALVYSFNLKTKVMNKLFGLLLAGVFCLGQHGLQAQVSDNASLLNVHTIGVDVAAVKASRDFLKRAGDLKEEQWYKMPEGYQAEYTDGPVKGRYVYNRKGNWVYSILTYGEERLPEDLRQLVRSTYFDFGIRWVKEVNEAQNLVYVIHIENDKAWKDVAVQDGEMRVLNAFCK